jgi:hypothetical protein
MKLGIFNRSNFFLIITTPSILFHKKDENEIECGPYLTELNTGIFYSKYDYGYMLKIQILGFGIDAWWML